MGNDTTMGKKPGANTDHEKEWQLRMLPFMVRMLWGLTFFFLAASFVQLFYLHSRIEHAPVLEKGALQQETSTASGAAPEVVLDSERLQIAALLEANTIARRYHQANVILMARVWSNYLGFVTGMILALVGAAFILGQLRTPGEDVSGKGHGFEINLKTASPGVLLCVLGVVLMITTIVSPQEISTQDVPVYLGTTNLPNAPAGKPRLDLAPHEEQANP